MKEKGFTLMELLAVIVILAIIIAITVPNVTKTLDRANKDLLQDNAEGLLTLVKQTYLDYAGSEIYIDVKDSILLVNGQNKGQLDYKGKMPESGCVKVDKDGIVRLAVSDGKYCSYKVDEVTPIQTEEMYPEECLEKLCN